MSSKGAQFSQAGIHSDTLKNRYRFPPDNSLPHLNTFPAGMTTLEICGDTSEIVGWVETQQKILSKDEIDMLGHNPTYV